MPDMGGLVGVDGGVFNDDFPRLSRGLPVRTAGELRLEERGPVEKKLR